MDHRERKVWRIEVVDVDCYTEYVNYGIFLYPKIFSNALFI
jgi:hypothetical protein